MHSQEPELRSAACQTVVVVCKNMSDDEQKNKLLPIMKKMSIDEVEYVKGMFCLMQSNWPRILSQFAVLFQLSS